MAKIGNLEIDTGKFANYAVNAVATGTTSVGVPNVGGFPIRVQATAKVVYTGSGSNSSGGTTVTIRRSRDNAILWQRGYSWSGGGTKTAYLSDMFYDKDATTSETYTYAFSGTGGDLGGSVSISNQKLLALYVKK